jgi:hypothetical protein
VGQLDCGSQNGLETDRIRAHIRSMSIASVIFLPAKISEGDWQIVCHYPGGKIEYVAGFSDEQSTKNWRMSGYRAAWLKSSDRGRNPPGTPYIRTPSDRSGNGLFSVCRTPKLSRRFYLTKIQSGGRPGASNLCAIVLDHVDDKGPPRTDGPARISGRIRAL